MDGKPLVTVSGKKIIFETDLHQRIVQDLPQEGVSWRRRSDSVSKSVYIDVNFVDFDKYPSGRIREDQPKSPALSVDQVDNLAVGDEIVKVKGVNKELVKQSSDIQQVETSFDTLNINDNSKVDIVEAQASIHENDQHEEQQNDVSKMFFNRKLLGQPILHTYWADKTDFEVENKKSQFEDWIGKVQASNCTEWAIIIVEDGDFKAQIGTALFKSKLQSTTSQANTSTSSIASISQASTSSFLDRMKKGLSTIFQIDSNSERWLTLINQNKPTDNKAQESYLQFIKKFRNVIMASFSKQIELFEEHLRVQREMRNEKNWDFLSFFMMQEELAFAFESLTLFDEALMQYDLLEALYSEYISSVSFSRKEDPLLEHWTNFDHWHGLCLDLNCDHSTQLRRKIVDRQASLLDFRNYLFAKQCDLILLQNQPWRVAASTLLFLQNCVREHENLGIDLFPGALSCWTFISALEVLQKCECYSCTSTMENYSLHTVDIWNCARRKLLELGQLCHRMPGVTADKQHTEHINKLLNGLGTDPHGGLSYQKNEISPQARLKDALAGKEQFSKHLIDLSELTLGTYKHIGRKRHALLIGKELAEFYMAKQNFRRALPFLLDMERNLIADKWQPLVTNIQKIITSCGRNEDKTDEVMMESA